MFARAQVRRERRGEIEDKLAEHGLVSGPRPLNTTPPLAFDDQSFARHLRTALEELGPLLALFGRYLASRLDLITISDSLELSRISDQAPPMEGARFQELVRVELGPTFDVFDHLDPLPRRSGWLRQTHRAVLKTGEKVLVRLARPGYVDEIDHEIAAAQPLDKIFEAYGRRLNFDTLFDEFRRELRQRLDLRREAEAFELLARGAGQREPLIVPRVYAEYSSRHLLVFEDPGGMSLDELAGRLSPMDREDLGRRLGLVWLRQALLGQAFPVEVEIRELEDGRLAWLGGIFTSLPREAQTDLWDYLRATAGHDPDQAIACLGRQLSRGRKAITDGELRSRIRQVVPFRDGGWSASGENLAEYVVLHWRVITENGFKAPPHVVSFYRGLYGIASAARLFQQDGDPFRDALGDLEWSAGWNQVRQMTAPGQLARTLESYLSNGLAAAPKLDRALEMASGEVARGRPGRARPEPDAAAPRAANAAVVALLMAMCAVVLAHQVLVARALVATDAAAVWAERSAALIFVAFSLLLLRSLWKRR